MQTKCILTFTNNTMRVQYADSMSSVVGMQNTCTEDSISAQSSATVQFVYRRVLEMG